MLELAGQVIGIVGVVATIAGLVIEWRRIRSMLRSLRMRLPGAKGHDGRMRKAIGVVNQAMVGALAPPPSVEIPAGIAALPPGADAAHQEPEAVIGVDAFAAALQPGLTAIVSESGTGKSHFAEALVRHLAQAGERLVLNIPVDMFALIDGVERNLAVGMAEEDFRQLADAGAIVILVDGLNQLPAERRTDAAMRLRNLASTYPKCPVLFTCRRSGFPNQLEMVTRRFTLGRPSRAHAHAFIDETLRAAGTRRSAADLDEHIWQLCDTPLLLTMLAAILSRAPEAELPRSRTRLYGNFIDNLFAREEGQVNFSLLRRHREALLSYMAFRKQDRGIEFDRAEIEEMIDSFLRHEPVPTAGGAEAFMREVPGHPPFEAAGAGPDGGRLYAYFHHSLLEYYCARWIHRHVPEPEQWRLLLDLATAPQDKFWPSIVFYAGFLDTADAFIRELVRHAGAHAESRDGQRLFRLAALCAAGSTIADPEVVDELVVAILVAFKFGTVSFNQELVETLRLVGPERRSRGFPRRITEDIDYWIDKYARVRSFGEPVTETMGELAEAIASTDPGRICEGLVRIGHHPARQTAAPAILELTTHPDALVREQAISTLGAMPPGHADTGMALCRIFQDPRRSGYERALAMLACGRLGFSGAFGFLEAYLREPANPFRENASWAIFGLVNANPADASMRRRAGRILLEAVLGPGSQYCIANALYCLAELGFTAYRADILAWHASQDHPHILEDGYIALGKLCEPADFSVFVPGLAHDDPLVRFAALRGLETLARRHPDAEAVPAALGEALAQLAGDPASVVRREAVRIASARP